MSRKRAALLKVVDAYLGLAHVRNPGVGCVLPALASEIGRSLESTREVFEDAFTALVDLIAEMVGDRSRATALVTHCAGAVMMARALAGEGARREVLDAAREGARRLLAE